MSAEKPCPSSSSGDNRGSLDQYTKRLANLPSASGLSHNGVLMKRGRGQKVSFIRPWSVRNFALDGIERTLTYYHGADIRGTVLLAEGTSVRPLPAGHAGLPGGFPFGFEILIAGGNNLELSAPDGESRQAWMKAIQATIQQDIISEAKIQKRVHDEEKTKNAAEKAEDAAEAARQAEENRLAADKLLGVKSASEGAEARRKAALLLPPKSTKADLERESEEADALLFGALSRTVVTKLAARAGSVAGDLPGARNLSAMQQPPGKSMPMQVTSPGTNVGGVMVSADLSSIHEHVLQEANKTKEKFEEERRLALQVVQMNKEMRDRDIKANELRRRHQVRQNFRAAVKRAIIRHQFMKGLHDRVQETKGERATAKATKAEETAILFSQGDNSDAARAMEKKLDKIAKERAIKRASVAAKEEAPAADGKATTPPPPRDGSVSPKMGRNAADSAPPPPTPPPPPLNVSPKGGGPTSPKPRADSDAPPPPPPPPAVVAVVAAAQSPLPPRPREDSAPLAPPWAAAAASPSPPAAPSRSDSDAPPPPRRAAESDAPPPPPRKVEEALEPEPAPAAAATSVVRKAKPAPPAGKKGEAAAANEEGEAVQPPIARRASIKLGAQDFPSGAEIFRRLSTTAPPPAPVEAAAAASPKPASSSDFVPAKEHPEYAKVFKLKALGVPRAQLIKKLEVLCLDTAPLDDPEVLVSLSGRGAAFSVGALFNALPDE